MEDEVKDQLLNVSVNPLTFIVADKRYKKNGPITEKNILQYISGYTMIPEITNFLKNYDAISERIPEVFAIPEEPRINTKIIQPLRHAVGSFMLGNYLDTISMCGFVAEMMAVFLKETSEITISNKPISEVEKNLFGREFEKLGQDRRIEILKSFSIIDDEIFAKFDTIRLTRAKYLHRFSEDHNQIAPDAKEVFTNTLSILISIFGQQIKDGKISYSTNVVRYLKNVGLLK